MTSAPKAKFLSWRAYNEFSRRVRLDRRYVWNLDVQQFLDAVVTTLKSRDVTIPKGHYFFRAQAGIQYDGRIDEEGNDLGEEPHGYGPDRMKPISQDPILHFP